MCSSKFVTVFTAQLIKWLFVSSASIPINSTLKCSEPFHSHRSLSGVCLCVYVRVLSHCVCWQSGRAIIVLTKWYWKSFRSCDIGGISFKATHHIFLSKLRPMHVVSVYSLHYVEKNNPMIFVIVEQDIAGIDFFALNLPSIFHKIEWNYIVCVRFWS